MKESGLVMLISTVSIIVITKWGQVLETEIMEAEGKNDQRQEGFIIINER